MTEASDVDRSLRVTAAHAVVVDPEPGSRTFVRLSLESAGYRVLEATDAEGAGQLIETHRDSLRLVVTAVQLPSGTEPLRSLPTLEPPFSAERLGAAIDQAKALAASATPVESSTPLVCPACGSHQIIPVVYGVASAVMKDFAAGRVALGGVHQAPGSPTWRCRDCDRSWSAAGPVPVDRR